ncbi:hypothetical protein [Streptomyces luteireticuli]|uniref:hypothetical protein n=1 Tax=Streptomyces luteireticuli TaxID=173858 RepID=UPI0035582CAD
MTPTLLAPASQALLARTPYITAWEYETPVQAPLVLARVWGVPWGIGFGKESLYDRDINRVLWSACGIMPGRGRPDYRRIHPQRQRRCMGSLLCQVCAGRADETEQGLLWLLDTEGLASPVPAEEERTTHPPVCRRHVGVAIGLCPTLRRGHVLVRVKEPVVAGVHGQVYRYYADLLRAGRHFLVPDGEKQYVNYTDPRARWTLAGQLFAELHGISPVIGDEYDAILREVSPA